jgi:hypothetical protein
MLPIGLLYITFTRLRYILCIPSFLRASIMKGCWILPKPFSASLDIIIRFLVLLLLIFCITFNDLHMLTHHQIFGMKPTWSWCMIIVCQYFIEDFCI